MEWPRRKSGLGLYAGEEVDTDQIHQFGVADRWIHTGLACILAPVCPCAIGAGVVHELENVGWHGHTGANRAGYRVISVGNPGAWKAASRCYNCLRIGRRSDACTRK